MSSTVISVAVIDIVNQKIQWLSTGDSEIIYSTILQEGNFYVRLNDFPSKAMYTLIFNNVKLIDFDDWPSTWIKP